MVPYWQYIVFAVATLLGVAESEVRPYVVQCSVISLFIGFWYFLWWLKSLKLWETPKWILAALFFVLLIPVVFCFYAQSTLTQLKRFGIVSPEVKLPSWFVLISK